MTEEQFSDFTESWPEAYLLVTGSGRIVRGNPVARRIFAETGDKPLEGRELQAEVLDSPDHLEKFLQVCRRSRQLIPGSLTLRTSNGGEENNAPFRAEGTLLEPPSDEGDEALLLIRLRSKVEADRRFQKLNLRIADLSREVVARREAEEKMRRLADQLTEADRRKDVFLATLAHELRNPLAPLRTGVEILQMKKDDPAIIDKMAQTMERQIKQLTVLVNDLLDVSRSTQNKIEIRPESVKLEEILHNAVEMCRPLIDECGHELVESFPPPSLEVWADPFRLTQVVSNLINNAAKYTPSGGRIELRAEQQGPEALIVVQDNGSGIPPEALENIFNMFEQLPQNKDRTTAGLGVGLTLVKALVELHGGTVSASSPGEDQGSAFEVRLPLQN
ncbi:MAG: PAS domain-containing sensor histidine kinase [Verrucomicrobiales bacterium]|nr:PAS domain-containing sensor histidine kinase [Verrucomicrobiales bacterium]